MKRIIYISLAILALVLTSACQREGTIYEMPANSACVSFPSSDAIYEMVAEDGNKILLANEKTGMLHHCAVVFVK